MLNEILDLIKNNGYKITDEIEFAVAELAETMEAQKKGLDDITEAQKWLEEKRKAYPAEVEEIGLKDVAKWRVDPETGNVSHETGKFFSLIGVKVDGAKGREVTSWTQPIMKQEECGILGILCQKKGGAMHYLLYAKFDPGPPAGLQFSPTLQATESNLKQVHGGKKPLFAEYFENGGKGKVIVNSVEVEDPGRFYHKTNRCMIVEVSEDEKVEIPDDFIWLTLAQIKKFLKIDNVVNSLTRCVLGSG